jgi:Tfp pilus assembly protein FimT
MTLGRPRRDQRGVTLVEISVVLGTLGLLLAIGVPSLQVWRDGIALRNAANGVSESMLGARMKSIVERRDYTVTVDYAADTCGVSPGPGPVKRWSSADIYADNSDPDCLSLSDQTVVFRPNSTADAAGFEAVYVKSKNTKVGVRYRIKVLGGTGKVSTERWIGGTWIGAF